MSDFSNDYDKTGHNKKRASVKRRLGTIQKDVHILLMFSLHAVYLSDRAGMVDFGPLVRDLTMLSEFGGMIRNKQSIFPWVEIFAGVLVEEDGKTGQIKVKKNKKWAGERDEVTFNEARDNPFFKIAPPEKPVKMPEVSWKAVAASMVRREWLGEPISEEMLSVPGLGDEIQAMRTSDGFMKWQEKAEVAIEKGDLQRLDS